MSSEAQYAKVSQSEDKEENKNEQQTVIVNIPGSYKPAKDYLFISLIDTFCCCFCIGVFALISSIRTREANRYQDAERAAESSQRAYQLNLLGIAIGLVIIVISILLIVILSHVFEALKTVYKG